MELYNGYKGRVASWTELIVFGASIFFAITDQYNAAYFGVLAVIYLAICRKL